jgi:hypothetical protein
LVQRDGAEHRVNLTVGQGVDDIKPLLFCFCVEEGPGTWQWIGWSPVGPYDRSIASAERFLGWHFNTGKLAAPATFALARDYREKQHTPGLFNLLVKHGQLSLALADPALLEPVPQPELDVRIAGAAEPDQHGHFLVRTQIAEVNVRIDGPSLGKNQVESLTWQLDNRSAVPLDLSLASEQELAHTLSLPDKPGVYSLRVVLRTREQNPKECVRDLKVRYQRPAPEVEFDKEWLKALQPQRGAAADEPRKLVRERKLSIRARVRPASGQTVHADLVHNGKRIDLPRALDIDRSLDLEPGENIVELLARNAEALANYEAFETDRKTLLVSFQEQEAPQIVLRHLALPGAAAEWIPIEPGRATIVRDAKIRVLGEIQASEELTEAAWLRAKAGRPRPLAKFEPGKTQKFSIEEELELEPGRHELEFRAKTTNSELASVRVAIEYRPQLPELFLQEPAADLVLYEGEHAPTVNLRGKLIPEKYPYLKELKIQVRVNAKEAAHHLEEKSQDLRADKLLLQPGANRIEVELQAWGANRVVPVHVTYRRPPRITELKPVTRGAEPFADLLGQVESPNELEPTEVQVNDRRLPWKDVTILEKTQGPANTTWKVRIPDVPLQQGENTIQLLVKNADGVSRKPEVRKVRHEPPPPPKPKVEIEPSQDAPVNQPQQTLRFLILSESTIKRIEVSNNGELVKSVPVRDTAKNPAGMFELKGAVEVALRPQPNVIKVAAVNAGGEADARVTLTYLPMPVRVLIDPPAPQVPTSPLWLNGRIVWQDERAAASVRGSVRVSVNGFQQRPVEWKPRVDQAREQAFTAEAVLNRDVGNRIQIETPGLAADAGGEHLFLVNCAKPQPPATLHVLIVSIGFGVEKEKRLTDKAELKRRAIQALQAEAVGGGLRSAAFKEVRLFDCLTGGGVTYAHVNGALRTLKQLIPAKGSCNDVVLIYWLGCEAYLESTKEWCLPTDESSDPNIPLQPRDLLRTAIPHGRLVKLGEEALGAWVLLLDVSPLSKGLALPEPDFSSSKTAILRYAWSKAVPVPGLIEALEHASRAGGPVHLGQVVQAAQQLRRQRFPDLTALSQNLQTHDAQAMHDLAMLQIIGKAK